MLTSPAASTDDGQAGTPPPSAWPRDSGSCRYSPGVTPGVLTNVATQSHLLSAAEWQPIFHPCVTKNLLMLPTDDIISNLCLKY